MDLIPAELIGNILSKVGAARDIVIASATCRKWREAFRKHLHTLSFSLDDWPYNQFGTSRLEILITKTLFQTTGLQDLSILINHGPRFSPSIVHAWLIYTRETLRVLRYNVGSYGYESVNILEICGRDKLEVIELTRISIVSLKPDFQRFHCLKSLVLRNVSVSALDLNTLLSACPTVQLFELINPTISITMSNVDKKVELSSASLRSIFLESVRVDRIILEADCLEILHVKDCNLMDFEVIGTGTLKQMKLDNVRVSHLCIGEGIESLEVVDISNLTISWPTFLEMISKFSSLRKLRLWNKDVTAEDEAVAVAEDESHSEEEDEEDDSEGDEDEEEVEDQGEEENIEDVDHSHVPQLTLPCVDLETVAVCFPMLSHLALCFDLKDEGSSYLTNVRVLELGWSVITDAFTEWVEGLLKRCPNLKKLVIHGNISAIKGEDKCRALAKFNSSMVQLVRSYMQVEVQFEFR